MGETPIVVVNDLRNVKKLLNHQDFNGRPVPLMVELRHPNFECYGRCESETLNEDLY